MTDRTATRIISRACLGFVLLAVQPALPVADDSPEIRFIEVVPGPGGEGHALLSVSDGAGRRLSGLSTANFTVRADGSLAAVLRLVKAAQGGRPLSIVLAVDVSGSMKGAGIEGARQGAIALLDRLGKQDLCALIAFGSGVRELADFTDDRERIRSALAKLTASDPRTHLYAALFDALDRAGRAPTSRVAVVLLTDGRDEGSPVGLQDVLTKATLRETPVFTLAYGRNADEPVLERVAAVSKGAFFRAPEPGRIVEAYLGIIERLQQDYLLVYPTPAGGRAHRLTVEVEYRGRRTQASINVRAAAEKPSEAPPPKPAIPWKVMLIIAVVVLVAAAATFWLWRRRQEPAQIAETLVPPRVWLEVVRGADAGQRFLLLPGDAIIGREPRRCHVVLKNDPMIGREHARVRHNEQGQYVIEDLRSRHGTSVNDVRIAEPVTLQANDRIQLGLSELLFIDQR